jgi:predicted ATPase/class 3 adenylate cyclase
LRRASDTAPFSDHPQRANPKFSSDDRSSPRRGQTIHAVPTFPSTPVSTARILRAEFHSPIVLTIETLTFLFTDVEGSTALLARLGANAYARALGEHHAIVRGALAAHGGTEEGTRGDSFFATFTSPSACIAAVLDMQHQLADQEWPAGEQLRVRMGVHVGEAAAESTGLVGYEVHRAARIGAVAHGGQVLLSSAAAGLVEDSLPRDATLRDLGTHRLKDLGRPETLFQLEAPGLRDQFPPLRSLDNPELPNNLPTSLSPFIGRTAEVREVVALLETARLVTLTGAGGSGKTRLALQAAAELLDGSGEGVWLVELAPVSDPEHVARTVIDALEIRSDAERDDRGALLHALKDQRCLVVFDNCEHLVDEVAKLADLIGRSCPKVSILATSREPLGVDGEDVYRVRSLTLPPRVVEGAEDLLGAESVDLFVARTRSLDKGFRVSDENAALVGAICWRLDGIPLAIELAAARMSSMSVQHLHGRLDSRFRLLTGGSRNALPRQQTLAATVAWSYDLLVEPEREVLRRLAVFVDGFTLEAAEAVCATDAVDAFDVGDILGSLVNKSMVYAERTHTSLRYGILETIRQFAAEQLLLVDGEDASLELRRLHADYFKDACTRMEDELFGPRQGVIFKQLDLEWGNVQAALGHLVDAERFEDAVELVVAVDRFLRSRSIREPLVLLRGTLDQIGPEHDVLRARALIALVESTVAERMNGRAPFVDATTCMEAVQTAQRLGDRRLEAQAWGAVAVTQWAVDDEDGQASAETALAAARETGDSRLVGDALSWLAMQRRRGDPDRLALYEEALEHLRRAGDLYEIYAVLTMLLIERGAANVEDAIDSRALLHEQLKISDELGTNLANDVPVINLSLTECYLGNTNLADSLARSATRQMRRIGRSPAAMLWPALALGICAARRGQYERAAELLGVVESCEQPWYAKWGDTWQSSERQMQEEAMTQILAAIGGEEYARLMASGRALSYDDMVDLLLERGERKPS